MELHQLNVVIVIFLQISQSRDILSNLVQLISLIVQYVWTIKMLCHSFASSARLTYVTLFATFVYVYICISFTHCAYLSVLCLAYHADTYLVLKGSRNSFSLYFIIFHFDILFVILLSHSYL